MAEQTEINKRLQYSILEYIKSQVAGSDEDTAESLNVALDCLSSCFGLSLQDTQQAQLYSVKPATLEAIFSVGHRQVVSAIQSAKAAHVSQKTSEAAPFEKPKLSAEDQVLEQHLKSKGIFKSVEEGSKEYYEILEKAKAKLQGRTATPQAEESLEAKTKRAEDLKARGNEMINEKKFEEAVVLYTKAIELVPTHIYYGNRAAAYFQLKKYDEAIQDCKESIRLNSNYAKAYYRLGQSYSQLGKYKEALSEGFEVAALLEPNNESYQAVVEEVKQKLKPQRPAAPAGGMPDFASLLSNPAIMNMASQMMSNPAMMNQMLGMFGGYFRFSRSADVLLSPVQLLDEYSVLMRHQDHAPYTLCSILSGSS
eukprot:TRINITY_DN533_c0_g1_i2.p1 TRINITY_DN533_c0_g1~~TRINITY_DN533_c0_g1_i2.p1  ORF type:complete len:367 (+),score=99.26 TRINITY_DN533_c0_g1_i2:67-1167(+)